MKPTSRKGARARKRARIEELVSSLFFFVFLSFVYAEKDKEQRD